jgi:hypothetical protein
MFYIKFIFTLLLIVIISLLIIYCFNNKFKEQLKLIKKEIDTDKFIFNDLIYDQVKNKKNYIKKISSKNDNLSITIKNNKIINTKSHTPNHYRCKAYTKLIEDVLDRYTIKDGNINIIISDNPTPGHLNFCKKNNDNNCFLIPIFRFGKNDIIMNENYELTSKYLLNLHINYPFDKKINKFYTSCTPHKAKLDFCKFALNNQNLANVYIYIGPPHFNDKMMNKIEIEKYKKFKMAGTHKKPYIDHFKYKYIIYNDGYTLSDRMNIMLCTNSVIIRKKSPYIEFYTHLLKNYYNYVEYKDTNELFNIYENLENNNNNNLCQSIIKNNINFSQNIINYDNVCKYTAKLINNII